MLHVLKSVGTKCTEYYIFNDLIDHQHDYWGLNIEEAIYDYLTIAEEHYDIMSTLPDYLESSSAIIIVSLPDDYDIEQFDKDYPELFI